MRLIPDPPKRASREWLLAFADELMFLQPGLPVDNAMRCAYLAHTGTWLLEPTEAAQLWLEAISVAARDMQRPPRGWVG